MERSKRLREEEMTAFVGKSLVLTALTAQVSDVWELLVASFVLSGDQKLMVDLPVI